MKTQMIACSVLVSALCCSAAAPSDAHAPRAERGGPLVDVSHAAGQWILAGRKHKVTIDESTLAMTVEAGPVKWTMAPSTVDDMVLKSRGEEFNARLTDAGKIVITPYDTGFKTGVKIRLEHFRHNGLLNKGADLELALVLTVCLEGTAEELVCSVAAIERETVVRQLDWPKEVDTRGANYSALNHVRGNLLPCDWPKAYHPYHNVPSQDQEQFVDSDKSYIQSNLIETWSMSWWGFQKGKSALVVLVETPDDAAYKFHHPPGGPTVLGPRWLASLGKLAYPRSVRMTFIPEGNYVTMAKRYRKHVIDSGLFVSLKEKIAQEPQVGEMIGIPHAGQRILRNYKPGSRRYNPTNDAVNYQLTTFDERARQLREWKAKGVEKAFISLSAWPYRGYDRQHPDVWPPAPEAGGWDGFKRWADTAKELGYLYVLHDQYRDYYVDAPSWDPQFAAHEEDNVKDASTFPGTRFGGWKEGYIPFMDYWDGGKMAYLSESFALGHLVKNYELMFERGIRTTGTYLDVFGYVPPTEDFNPEHPVTRTAAMKARAACFQWARRNLGIIGTEDGADWVMPYVDYCTDANAGSVIPAPLYVLVYHDAVMLPEGGSGNFLRCLLNGGFAGLPRNLEDPAAMDRMRTICALHKRVALLEMMNHEFLDDKYRKERSTFADGTTVTIDRDAGTFEIKPELKF